MNNIFKKISTWQWLLGIMILSFILFFPAFKTFFTNDDFFHFIVSRAYNFKDFLNFFYLPTSLTGYPHYRPLTIQTPYFLDWKLFNLNPLPFHILSFIILSAVTVLSYRLIKIITKNKPVALIAALFYATSASHFGHLNISAPAEIGYTLLALLSVNFFVDFLAKKRVRFLSVSIIFFILGLLAKENSVIVPPLLILVYVFYGITNKRKFNWKELMVILTPFLVLLTGYLYTRFFKYGLAVGDSYVWNFSPIKAINTISWYSLWSLNLPEMLVDFVGPGLKLNPNLLIYYSKEMVPIFILFGLELAILLYSFIKFVINIFINRKPEKSLTIHYPLFIILFGVIWFILSLVPVLFLPLHKFTFYLALPLVGVVVVLATILTLPKISNKLIVGFVCVWLASSFLTLKLTYKTNWITRGAEVSKRVYSYFKENYGRYQGKTVLFYDTEDDNNLPFSPTMTLKNTLSDDNFFKIFFNGRISARYEGEAGFQGWEKVKSRQFLGY